jgi:hypothetical protein
MTKNLVTKFYNGKPIKCYLKLLDKIQYVENISINEIERLYFKVKKRS